MTGSSGWIVPFGMGTSTSIDKKARLLFQHTIRRKSLAPCSLFRSATCGSSLFIYPTRRRVWRLVTLIEEHQKKPHRHARILKHISFSLAPFQRDDLIKTEAFQHRLGLGGCTNCIPMLNIILPMKGNRPLDRISQQKAAPRSICPYISRRCCHYRCQIHRESPIRPVFYRPVKYMPLTYFVVYQRVYRVLF